MTWCWLALPFCSANSCSALRRHSDHMAEVVAGFPKVGRRIVSSSTVFSDFEHLENSRKGEELLWYPYVILRQICQEIKSFHFYGSCTTEQHCDVTQLAALGSPPTPKTQTRPEPKHQQSPTQECVGRSITLKEDFFTASSVFQPCDITGVPHFIY